MPSMTAMNKNDPLAMFKDGAVAKGTDKPVPLVSTKIGVRIVGGLALVTTERTFRNIEDRSIEATVTFPVPVHATLVGLTAAIDGRTLVAAAQRRQKARETYEEALDGGKTAVLHEEALRGIHMLSIGHVPAGKEISVTSVWAATLGEVDGTIALRIPTTVGDIYGRSPLSDSDDLVHAAITHKGTLEVECEDGTAHLVGGGLKQGRADVVLDAPIDLVVTNWAPRELGGVSADGRAVTLSIVPAPKGEADVDLEVLADISGSMNEAFDGSREYGGRFTKHDAMLRGLSDAMRTLRANDRIRLWQFNTSVSEVGSATGGDAAQALLGKIGGSYGGTSIGPALATVTARSEASDIILITDGKSYDINVQELARTGKRFTVVLIGEDSLDANVGYLAAMTGGQIFVSGGVDAASAVRAAVAAVRTRHVQVPRIEGEIKAVTAFRGGMIVEARWGKKAAMASSADAIAIGAFAAALAIPSLDEDAAAAMAEAHGIVCHLTSLVLVDDEGEQQEGIPAQRKVPLMTPRTAMDISAAAMPMATYAMAPMSFDASPLRGIAASGTMGPTLAAMRTSGKRVDSVTHSFDKQEPVGRWVDWDSVNSGMGLPGMPGDKPTLPGFPSMPSAPAAPDLGKLLAADLKWAVGKVDWSHDPDALRRGDLSGLDQAIVTALRHAAMTSQVSDLAKELGVDAVSVAVALLANAEPGDRGAGRVFRTVLGKADTAKINAAMRAVGL